MMKIATLVFILSMTIQYYAKAQSSNQASTYLSNNQIEIDYQYSPINRKIWAEAFIGLGNQDVGSEFNDLTSGFRLGYPLFICSKNAINLTTTISAYFPKNSYYSAPTLVLSGGLRYSYFFGNTKKHSLNINVAYQYGNRTYLQNYENEHLSVSTLGEFKIAPFHFSIGYGLRLFDR